MSLEGDGPLALHYECDFRRVLLLLQDEAVTSSSLVHAWLEPKSNLVAELSVEFFARVEEGLEGWLAEDIVVKKFSHQELLDVGGNAFEVLCIL